MIKPFFATALLGLTVAVPQASIAYSDAPGASEWSIGPVIKGRNYSVNMPQTMFETRHGPAFDFPFPNAAAGHVHYVTTPIRSLAGAERITLTYRIDAEPGTAFLQQEAAAEPGTLSLYIQQRGDSWTRRHPTHRWYSPDSQDVPLRAGTHTVSISLDEPWVAVLGGDAHSKPGAFQRALQEAAVVGFTFGGSAGRGHGVFATKPARFTLLDFRIE